MGAPLDATVVVGTFGDESWRRLAWTRAVPSAEAEDVPWVHCHRATLAEARTAGLELVCTPWVIHLDADDELEPGYVEAMARGTADLRAPAVKWIRLGHDRGARMPQVAGHRHQCEAACLRQGNWIVIGACARTELVRKAGWHEFPWSEDWATWALCWRQGATVEPIHDAVYRAHVRTDSRNRGQPRADRLAAHRAIERFVWPEEYAA